MFVDDPDEKFDGTSRAKPTLSRVVAETRDEMSSEIRPYTPSKDQEIDELLRYVVEREIIKDR